MTAGASLFLESGAKVGVLREKRSHSCDIFVTCCDLMKIARKLSQKGIKKTTPKGRLLLVSADVHA